MDSEEASDDEKDSASSEDDSAGSAVPAAKSATPVTAGKDPFEGLNSKERRLLKRKLERGDAEAAPMARVEPSPSS